jgi:hypothetical protein
MIRNLLLAAAFTGLSTMAFAQSNPHFVGEGNNPHVAYDAPSANIVGAADATVSGAPGQVHYETQRVYRTQAPTAARDPSSIVVRSHN